MEDDINLFNKGQSGTLRRESEDVVEYSIYVMDSELVSRVQINARLKEVQAAATRLSTLLLKDYIWHSDDFNLEFKLENGVHFLHGSTQYGDSVADEWVIVYLLRQLSTQFHNIWLRVHDSDGEFLLIEAAKVLPRWLNPEIAEFRVWINKGQLLIIPLQKSERSASKFLSLEKALDLISSQKSSLLHSQLIEEEAFYRLRNYPAGISENFHHALVTIPRKLAFFLHENPRGISAATEAFCLRDPISLKSLDHKDTKNLIFAPDDLVNVSVKFTKVGYAQLKSQDFSAPAYWTTALSKPLSAEAASQMQTGIKVTSGYEMLLKDKQYQDRKVVREIKLLMEDLDEGTVEIPLKDAMKDWPDRQDDEGWLDIDFEAFERELSGRAAAGGAKLGDGFGDKSAQENLRKMVERFEAFLNDDTADPEGVEDENQIDSDDDFSDSGNDEEGEDQMASFNEQEFELAMREMMGMPSSSSGPTDPSIAGHMPSGRVRELDPDEDDDDDEQERMKNVIQQMEDELQSLGALDLNPPPSHSLQPGHSGRDEKNMEAKKDDPKSTLAQNLLESFKAQGGTAGPVGNMMGMMGVRLPRNEE